jgi:hypothetical protein
VKDGGGVESLKIECKSSTNMISGLLIIILQCNYYYRVQTYYLNNKLNNGFKLIKGRAISQGLVAGFQPRLPGFKPGSSHVGFVVDKVALGQVFSEYFDFPCQS